jgi:hypothetical protein
VKSNSDKLLSIPCVNQCKKEMRSILEVLKEDVDGDFDIETAIDMGDGTYKMKENRLDEEENDVLAFGWDLNTYSLKKRNERLCISTKPINGDYANFNIFSGMTKRRLDAETLSDEAINTLCFLDRPRYNKTGQGYFMGEELENIFKAENVFDVEEMKRNLNNYYTILDAFDGEEDDDFDPEDYVVSNFMTLDGKKVKKYHWEFFDGPIRNPEIYKLLCEHPKIVNDLFDRRNDDLCIPSNVYPGNVIKEYEESLRTREAVMCDANLSKPKEMIKNMNERKLHIVGYSKVVNETGKVVGYEKNMDDPYSALDIAFDKRKQTNTGGNIAKKAKIAIADRMNGKPLSEELSLRPSQYVVPHRKGKIIHHKW